MAVEGAQFAQQQDQQLLLMIESGVDAEMASQMLEDRQTQFVSWRGETLAMVRERFDREAGR